MAKLELVPSLFVDDIQERSLLSKALDVLKQNPRDVGFNLSDHTNERQTLKRFLKYYLNVVEKSKKMKEKFAKKGIKSIQAHDLAVDKQDYIRKYSEFAGPNALTGMEGQVPDNKIDANPKKKVPSTLRP